MTSPATLTVHWFAGAGISDTELNISHEPSGHVIDLYPRQNGIVKRGLALIVSEKCVE
jgi:hypothetical protein